MKLFIDSNDDFTGVKVYTFTETGRRGKTIELTREEAIGVATRLLECAGRIHS
jgi:hypothetical protein